MGNEEQCCESLQPAGTPVVRLRTVDIQEVCNGFTVNIRGGKAVDNSYNRSVNVASTVEEAIEIAKNHLS